ncbi:hypothetical protein ACHQM5_010123 [Ranunculus cassubicifolius]
MESQMSPLNWPYLYQNMDELRYSLLYTSLELETARLEAQEEIKKRDAQVTHLKHLLNKAIRERDESQEHQKLLTEKLLLVQQQQQTSSSIEEEMRRADSNTGISSSDCEESIVSSSSTLTPSLLELASEKPLPEKGKFLEAVIKAGPLLQTLLLAGPLPQWQHPPPQLNSIEIPPVVIPSAHHHDSSTFPINSNNDNGACFNQKKRPLTVNQGSYSSTNAKYQKIAPR